MSGAKIRYVKDWQLAYELCCASAKDCATQSVWTPVAKFSLEGAIRSHRELGTVKGAEWTMLALAYLRVCALQPKGLEAEELEWVISGLNDCEGLDESESTLLLFPNCADGRCRAP
jgi:hypothetical protein